MQQWLANKRKSLIDQGAVILFDDPDMNDQIAKKANTGLASGIPGLGLYKRGDASYEMRLAGTLLENGEDYSRYSAEDWQRLLTTRDRQLKYQSHRSQYGSQPFRWKHIVVLFRVQLEQIALIEQVGSDNEETLIDDMLDFMPITTRPIKLILRKVKK